MIQTVEVNGVSVRCFDAGSGPVILFVHGFPLDHSMWASQLDEFQSGYRVIAPDLRGFGQSGGASDHFSMGQYADDLVELLDVLNITDPVTYCGLSMGGYIGWQFALHHSDRLARLIQCDTRAAADDEAGRKKRGLVAEMVLKAGPGFLADAMPESLFAASTRSSAPEIVEQTQAVISATNPQAIAAASLGMADRPDVTDQLEKMDCPALLICGTDDALVTPAEMKRIAEQMPHGQFAAIAGAGHMAPLENPQAVNACISEFLAATDM